MPGLSATFVGGLLGFCGAMYSNGIRKLPLMRSPWEHVVWVAGGSMLASWIVTGEAAIDAKIEKRLLERAEGNKNFKPDYK